MRIVRTIKHPHITISIFSMNDKYVIKLEAGPMEQAFKVAMNEIAGPDAIEQLLDKEFMQKALERFKEMFASFQNAQERLEQAHSE
jgi:hypothetical protein